MRLFCWSRAVVFSMARAPGCGLAALCLVSRRSVWYRGALLRGLSQCRCGCELVSPCESLASRVPVVPLPLRSKHSGTTVAFRHRPCSSWGGRDGSICRGGRIICQLHQLGPPLCGPRHRQPSPRSEDSPQGLVRGRILSDFSVLQYINCGRAILSSSVRVFAVVFLFSFFHLRVSWVYLRVNFVFASFCPSFFFFVPRRCLLRHVLVRGCPCGALRCLSRY